MNKKALLPGQVLAFIIAGIIFVLVLGFGYKAISDMLKGASDIGVAELKTDLESAVESTKRSFGSVRKIELRSPKEIDELCFFDYDKCGSLSTPVSFDGKPLDWAVRACQAKSANVFSIPRLLDLSLVDVKVDDGFVCVPNVGGIVTIKLVGRGDHVLVDEWSFE